MADNIILNLGSGGDTTRAEDIAGIKIPVVKIHNGANGVDGGSVTAANPLDVKAVLRTAAKGTTIAADATSTPVDVNTQALDVSVKTTAGLTDLQIRATALPVSLVSTTITGSVAVIGPLTDAQIRLTPLPVSGTVAANATLTAGTNSIGTVQQAALTKGTQGTTGVTVQQLRHAGRARVSITFLAVAPAVADALLTLVKVTNGAAAAGAASIGVAAGKILVISSITFSIKSGAAAAAFATLTLRQNPVGATVIGSVAETRIDLGNTAAVIGAADKVVIVFAEGMEFSGTQTLGVSLAAQAITNVISISINGYEY